MVDLKIIDVFENLSKKAIEFIRNKYNSGIGKDKYSLLGLTNTLFESDDDSYNGTYQLNITIGHDKKTVKNKQQPNPNDADLLKDAATIIGEYFTEFNKIDKNFKKIIVNPKDVKAEQVKDIGVKYEVEYDLIKPKSMNENISIKTLTESEDITFSITPGQLLGKLHDAAFEQVKAKYGKDVGLTNSAIDTTQKPSVATVKEADYVIRIQTPKVKDKEKIKNLAKDILTMYVTTFAGEDIAKTVSNPKWYQIFKKSDDNEENKDKDKELLGLSVHYHLGVSKANPEKSTSSFWSRFKSMFSESFSIQFEKCEKTILESTKLLKQLNILVESKDKKNMDRKQKKEESNSSELVKHIMNNNNVKANKLLEKVLAKKVDKRIKDILEN